MTRLAHPACSTAEANYAITQTAEEMESWTGQCAAVEAARGKQGSGGFMGVEGSKAISIAMRERIGLDARRDHTLTELLG